MRLLLDTNIILEYLCGRSKALVVRELLDSIEDNGHEMLLSSFSFCTIAYYIELSFKQMGIHKPEKTQRTRETLNALLGFVTIADTTHERTCVATNDNSFSDFEDSMQYQCAVHNRCDFLITFNVKDFKNVSQGSVRVLAPEDFMSDRLAYNDNLDN